MPVHESRRAAGFRVRAVGAAALALTFVLAGLVLPANAQPSAPPAVPVFEAGIEYVNVDVRVTRDGRRVDGLKADSFLVTDQGVRQQVEVVGDQDTAVDVVLALDASSSVAGRRLAALKKGAHAFIDALGPADSLTILGFASELVLALPPGRSLAEAHAAVEGFSGRGPTSLVDAVHAALLLSDTDRGRPLVLVFSDGDDRGSWLSFESVLEQVRAAEAVVHAVEAPAERRQPYLKRLTEETGGQVFKIGRDAELEEAFKAALAEFRGRYRLRFEPRGVRPGGWHELKVQLVEPKADVQARKGYRSRAGASSAR